MPDTALSWTWWAFTTIVLALFINLLSDYMKPKIDSVLGKYSNKVKMKNETEKGEIDGLAKAMMSDSRFEMRIHNIWVISTIRHSASAVFLFICMGISTLIFIDLSHIALFVEPSSFKVFFTSMISQSKSAIFEFSMGLGWLICACIFLIDEIRIKKLLSWQLKIIYRYWHLLSLNKSDEKNRDL